MPLVFRTVEDTEVYLDYANIATVEAYSPPPISIWPGQFLQGRPQQAEVTITTRDHRVYTVHGDDMYRVCEQVSTYYAHSIPEDKKPIFEL